MSIPQKNSFKPCSRQRRSYDKMNWFRSISCIDPKSYKVKNKTEEEGQALGTQVVLTLRKEKQ